MRRRGITHVLVPASTGHPHTPPPLFPGRFEYLIWPAIEDAPDFPIVWAFPAFTAAIKLALAGGGGVLLHCADGLGRSPAVAAAYLMATEGVPADLAFGSIRAKRPRIADANFRDQVALWGRLRFLVWTCQEGLGVLA